MIRGTKTMQRVTLVRYKAKPDRAEENEALSRAVFAELRAQAPDGVTYALFRDGLDFVHLFVNSEADDSDAVTELATFKVFSKAVSERCEAPPEVTRLSLNLIESYGLASAMAPA
jgi:quinol monooxygenase YgiN